MRHRALDNIDQMLQADEIAGSLAPRIRIGKDFDDHLPPLLDELVAQMPQMFQVLCCHDLCFLAPRRS